MSVRRQEGGRAYQERDETVHQTVGAFDCLFSCGDNEYICMAAKAIRKCRMYELPRLVVGRGSKYSTLTDANVICSGNGEDCPANCLAGGLTRLAFDAAARPSFCVAFHTITPVEEFKVF